MFPEVKKGIYLVESNSCYLPGSENEFPGNGKRYLPGRR